MRFLVNLFGILGILTTVVIYQQKDNQRMLVWKLISDLCWVLHYLALGANSVAVVTIVAIMRSVVLLCRRHRWAQSRAWLAVFMASSFVLGGQIAKSADLFGLRLDVPWRVSQHLDDAALRGASAYAAQGRAACELLFDPTDCMTDCKG